ncbi:Asp-tRNA(Asn)/Glu-tRNA(Gln) amidotransferase subunit GatC [Mucilaginibacter jinjuensis]|uniref:Aspartyl/glutamyl-tRNA(Asn/Gln) amidotransferase subunit C n=1 Tax=Mucilaginibacter jinjuensis TaxID=1176721 RepID=A0ABY7T6T0_9SPHI|nr:Asp-tRNA(Asn)/Glu-tRNA(Gln) amidotransferase subunit GatC [Mucilaginibacter jinjuensis]WCT10942.1 Asp-tRNA(Asn)/Glu-tRNA(Gln) amidotransferase subunit GatC [Mucilaginibacter jinjuensis]
MKITEDTVDKIAHLARLEVSADEKEQLMADMSRILTFMDKLNEVDTSSVEPLVYMTGEVNVFRKDEVKELITHDEALQNAPERDENYFLVPKVIETRNHADGKADKSV